MARRAPTTPAEPTLTARVREGGPADLKFLIALGTEVFGHLGDYARILPAWLGQPGVHLYIAEAGGRPVGFALMGFERDDEYEGPPPPPEVGGGDWLAADVLAIAVMPSLQGKGLGRALLGHVLARIVEVSGWRPVNEARLTVSEKNDQARRLFARAGFVDAGVEGRYPNGQRALRMRRPLVLS